MSNIFNIVSIDPGQSTGLVIANVKISVDYVVIRRKYCETLTETRDIVDYVLSTKGRRVVMENRPMYASKEGLDPWMDIYTSVINECGYKLSSKIEYTDDKGRSIFLVGPSQWKPFMKSRMNNGLGLKELKSQHEKDACCLLHYFIQMNNKDKEIVYE